MRVGLNRMSCPKDQPEIAEKSVRSMEELDTQSLADEDRPPVPQSKPSTITVVMLLMSMAAVFSYLGAYALRDALIRSNMIHPTAGARDTRLFWAIAAFTGQMIAFLCIAVFMKFLSWRQFRRIDQMLEADGAKDKL